MADASSVYLAITYHTIRRMALSIEEITKSSVPTLHVFLQHTMRGMTRPVLRTMQPGPEQAGSCAENATP